MTTNKILCQIDVNSGMGTVMVVVRHGGDCQGFGNKSLCVNECARLSCFRD